MTTTQEATRQLDAATANLNKHNSARWNSPESYNPKAHKAAYTRVTNAQKALDAAVAHEAEAKAFTESVKYLAVAAESAERSKSDEARTMSRPGDLEWAMGNAHGARQAFLSAYTAWLGTQPVRPRVFSVYEERQWAEAAPGEAFEPVARVVAANRHAACRVWATVFGGTMSDYTAMDNGGAFEATDVNLFGEVEW